MSLECIELIDQEHLMKLVKKSDTRVSEIAPTQWFRDPSRPLDLYVMQADTPADEEYRRAFNLVTGHTVNVWMETTVELLETPNFDG